MNKKVTIMAAVFAMAIPLAPVLAEDVTTISTDVSQVRVKPVPAGDRSQVRVELKEQRQQSQQDRAQIAIERDNQNQQEKDFRQEKIQDRCKNIQTRIDSQSKRYVNNKQMFLTVFGNMKARLVRLSERLKNAGVDVTKLNEDIATLDTKIAKLSTDHDAFITTLNEANVTATTECATTPGGKFMGKLLGARKVASTVEQDRLDIRNFFQSTIRPDIMAIRKQLESQKTNDDIENGDVANSKETKTTAATSNSATSETANTTIAQ